MKRDIATVEQLGELSSFDQIIDVRSPGEFAEDHIPGSINCPVLDNQQRIEIGTLYKQASPFEAKKLGAAYVSTNIARHLQAQFLDRPKNWRPLIVCWRGGQRSGAMTYVFRRVGWWRAGSAPDTPTARIRRLRIRRLGVRIPPGALCVETGRRRPLTVDSPNGGAAGPVTAGY